MIPCFCRKYKTEKWTPVKNKLNCGTFASITLPWTSFAVEYALNAGLVAG